jgi:hypothetical protein
MSITEDVSFQSAEGSSGIDDSPSTNMNDVGEDNEDEDEDEEDELAVAFVIFALIRVEVRSSADSICIRFESEMS